MSPLGHIVERCEESCHFLPSTALPEGRAIKACRLLSFRTSKRFLKRQPALSEDAFDHVDGMRRKQMKKQRREEPRPITPLFLHRFFLFFPLKGEFSKFF
jgi:hypothetical protein